jgi:hypothetical protein
MLGLVSAVLGLLSTPAIEIFLAHGKETTEFGDAALAIYAFLTFGATGFIAAFAAKYGIVRRKVYAPLLITCIAMSINIVGFLVPTGGYALAPFYASIAIGFGLTAVFLMPRPNLPASVRPKPEDQHTSA